MYGYCSHFDLCAFAYQARCESAKLQKFEGAKAKEFRCKDATAKREEGFYLYMQCGGLRAYYELKFLNILLGYVIPGIFLTLMSKPYYNLLHIKCIALMCVCPSRIMSLSSVSLLFLVQCHGLNKGRIILL